MSVSAAKDGGVSIVMEVRGKGMRTELLRPFHILFPFLAAWHVEEVTDERMFSGARRKGKRVAAAVCVKVGYDADQCDQRRKAGTDERHCETGGDSKKV